MVQGAVAILPLFCQHTVILIFWLNNVVLGSGPNSGVYYFHLLPFDAQLKIIQWSVSLCPIASHSFDIQVIHQVVYCWSLLLCSNLMSSSCIERILVLCLMGLLNSFRNWKHAIDLLRVLTRNGNLYNWKTLLCAWLTNLVNL